IADAKTSEQREEIRKRSDLRIPALGSGSDYTAFLQHDGVAALNIGFGGEDQGGIYHSIYDDFYWFTHFSDTDFVYGRALAQSGGVSQGVGTCERQWRRGAGLRSARRSQQNAHRERAQTHQCRGTAQSPLVQAPALCAGFLHWLRCQDGARGARSHRAKKMA